MGALRIVFVFVFRRPMNRPQLALEYNGIVIWNAVMVRHGNETLAKQTRSQGSSCHKNAIVIQFSWKCRCLRRAPGGQPNVQTTNRVMIRCCCIAVDSVWKMARRIAFVWAPILGIWAFFSPFGLRAAAMWWMILNQPICCWKLSYRILFWK